MNYYNKIKKELVNNEIYKKVKDYSKNKSDLKTYYNVGKLLSEAGKHYGESIIKNYSKKLSVELGKGYSWRNLYNMKLYYLKFKDDKILQTLSAKLTWSHISELIKYDDTNKIYYYINIINNYSLSVRELREKIKNNPSKH